VDCTLQTFAFAANVLGRGKEGIGYSEHSKTWRTVTEYTQLASVWLGQEIPRRVATGQHGQQHDLLPQLRGSLIGRVFLNSAPPRCDVLKSLAMRSKREFRYDNAESSDKLQAAQP
jgi:hypothetical protein